MWPSRRRLCGCVLLGDRVRTGRTPSEASIYLALIFTGDLSVERIYFRDLGLYFVAELDLIYRLEIESKNRSDLIEIGCRAPEEINLPGDGAMRK